MLMRGTRRNTLFCYICMMIDISFYFSTSNQKPLRFDCPRNTSSSPASHRLLLKVHADVGRGWWLRAFAGRFNWLCWRVCSRCSDGRPFLAELHGTGGPSHLFSGWISRPAVLSAAPTQHSSPARSDCRKQRTQQGRCTDSRSVSGIQWARWTRCVPVRLHLRHMHD